MNFTLNKKTIGSLSAAGLLLASGVWWYWGAAAATEPAANKAEAGRAPGGAGRPTPVLVARIKNGDVRVVQTAVGSAVPSSMLTLRSRVNGQLVRVTFKEGQSVRAGEVLAEIDPRPFQALLLQAEGQAMRNQALLKNAQLDLERYRTLQAQDSIAAQQVDAQAALVQQYQGTVLTDRGLVDNARLQLGYTRITSPISGRIGLRQIDVGNNITTTDILAVVNAVDPIQVVFTLPEDRASNIVKRQRESRLPVEAWDRGNTTLLAKGELVSVDNQIDAASGTIKLKAQFANADAALFPNQFVNIHLLSDTLRDAVIAPKAAIQHGSMGAFVYLLVAEEQSKGAPGKTVTVRPVVLGAEDGEVIAIEKGLAPGDQVVVSGIDRLREGARVVVSDGDGKGKSGERRSKKADGGPEGSESRRDKESQRRDNAAGNDAPRERPARPAQP